MMASPSTRPGNTSGSEARLSISQRPGSRVRMTIKAMTDVTSMTAVARPKALAGHGREAIALLRKPRLEIDAERRDQQQRHRIGRGEADLARIAVDRLVDRRGIDLDADRQAEQRRHLERFDRAHEQDQ